MKKFINIISVLCIILLLCSCQTREENYNIKSVNFKEVSMPDSVSHGKKYYILNFGIEFCNRIYVWDFSPISPGLKGISHNIDSIRIYDINDNDITPEMRRYGLDYRTFFTINGKKEFVYSPVSLDAFTKEINDREISTLGMKITDTRLFESDSTIIPGYINVYCSDTVISNNIVLIN